MAVAGKTLFGADTFSEADELGHALTVTLDWAGWIIGRPMAIAHILMRRQLGLLRERSSGRVAELARRAELGVRGPVLLFGERGRALARAIVVLDEHVQKMIDDRRSSSAVHGDLLARLLDARDEDGSVMSDRQIRDEVLTLFVAGHETTATGLAWTLHEACRDPRLYAEMEREADSVGTSRRWPTSGKLGCASAPSRRRSGSTPGLRLRARLDAGGHPRRIRRPAVDERHGVTLGHAP
ncbi:MAG: cytochrome P450 [Polyangiaceae bacterium]|nr:cytochrome P450 [Polyangiaceae bacterium]